MKFTGKTAAEVVTLIKNKKVRVIASGSGHGQVIGTVLTPKSPCVYNTGNGLQAVRFTATGTWYYITDIELISETKEELEQTLADLKRDVQLSEAKLAYLKETKQESFDETEFKVWNTLQVLSQKKTTDLEKAKAIAALINS